MNLNIRPGFVGLLAVVAVGSAVGSYLKERQLNAELLAAREDALALTIQLENATFEATTATNAAELALVRDSARIELRDSVASAVRRATLRLTASRGAIPPAIITPVPDECAQIYQRHNALAWALLDAEALVDTLRRQAAIDSTRADTLHRDLTRAKADLLQATGELAAAARAAAELAGGIPVQVGEPPPRLQAVGMIRQVAGAPLEASVGLKSGMLEVGGRVNALAGELRPQLYAAVSLDVRIF